MKLGFGLYRNMLTADSLRFARQVGATQIVAHPPGSAAPANSHNLILLLAPDTCIEMPLADYARQFFPEARIRPGLAKFGSLVDSSKAEKLIGFVPEYSLKR